MVSGYWQPNSVTIFIFSTIFLGSIQFCLSDLDSTRNAVRFPDLGRENSYFNYIQRSSEEIRNDPILSNNRYSEHLQAENNKGSNLNEVRYQKIRSLRLAETGLNKINKLIRVSRNERYFECSGLKGLSQSKCFSDSVETRRGQNGLLFAEERQDRKLTQRRQENLRQGRRERLQRRILVRESESLESSLHEKEAYRNLERNRRTQRNIGQLSGDERKNNFAASATVRTFRRNAVEPKIENNRLRIRDTTLYNRRQFNRATEDDMRTLRNSAISEKHRMGNFERKIARDTPDQRINEVSRRHYRIDLDRRMENRRIEGTQIFLQKNQRTQNTIIEKRNNIGQDVIENNRNLRAIVELREMVEPVQQFSYRKDLSRLEQTRATATKRDLTRRNELRSIGNSNNEVFENDQFSEQFIQQKIEQKGREEKEILIREKNVSSRQNLRVEIENLIRRERRSNREERENRQEETHREDDSVQRDTSDRNMNRKREYANLLIREQNQRDVHENRETRSEGKESLREERDTLRGERQNRREERETRREERENRREDDNLQLEFSTRNMNHKREYENLITNERNQRDNLEDRETRREENRSHREERETLREERQNRREVRGIRREERGIRREERETFREGNNLQRLFSARNMNRVREYENLMTKERSQQDIREDRETRREENKNYLEKRETRQEGRETRREERETRREQRETRREQRETRRETRQISRENDSLQRDTSTRNINRQQYEDLMSRKQNQQDIREERETRRVDGSLERESPARNLNRRREIIRTIRREDSNQYECQAPEISKLMIANNLATRNDRTTDIRYLRNERHEVDVILDSNNFGKNVWVNEYLLKPTPNIMISLIQGLLIGAIALKAFSFHNSKNAIGIQLNSMNPLKCF